MARAEGRVFFCGGEASPILEANKWALGLETSHWWNYLNAKKARRKEKISPVHDGDASHLVSDLVEEVSTPSDCMLGICEPGALTIALDPVE